MIGVAGWKNSGKTTLVTRLVAELTSRGFKVATVKHAHHDFQIDDADTDSARHRRAGAAQVAIVSPRRWAVVRELGAAPEPSLDEMIGRLEPCDLVIVEGYKAAPIPKIEVRRRAAARAVPLAATDPTVIAIAADSPATAPAGRCSPRRRRGHRRFHCEDAGYHAVQIGGGGRRGSTPVPFGAPFGVGHASQLEPVALAGVAVAGEPAHRTQGVEVDAERLGVDDAGASVHAQDLADDQLAAGAEHRRDGAPAFERRRRSR